jgi:hypothetical protein
VGEKPLSLAANLDYTQGIIGQRQFLKTSAAEPSLHLAAAALRLFAVQRLISRRGR